MEILVSFGRFSFSALCGFAFFCSISLENLLLPPPRVCSIETQSMWSMKEEIFICPLSQNGVKIVVAILHFSRFKTKGRGGSEHLPANVRHIENVLKVVSFQESLRHRRPLTHFSSSFSSSTLRDSLGMFLSGWNLSEGVSKQ